MSIQTEINRLNTAKANILTSISNKGVDTSSVNTLNDVPALIDSIETGGGGGGHTTKKGLIINSCNDDGFATDVSIVGFTEIPNYYCYYSFGYFNNYYNALAGTNLVVHLPENLEAIGSGCFMEGKRLNFTELPSSLKTIGESAFYGCSNMALIKLPSKLSSIGGSAFRGCSKLTLTEIPSGVIKLNDSTFHGCSNLTQLTFIGDIFYLGTYEFYTCNKLTKLIFPHITKVPTLSNTNSFLSTPIANGTGYIYVPDELVSSFKSANNWKTYADQILPISEVDLYRFEINCKDELNLYYNVYSTPIELLYNGITYFSKEEQKGYTLSINGNATINNEKNLITLTNNAKVGDIITITITSTYDTSITTTKQIKVVNVAPSISVDLNNGQWVDSGTKVNGNVVYKSDSGSYNINNGKSTATITVNGYTNVKLYIRSYAESTYDYTEAFAVDTLAVRSSGLYTTKGKQSASNYIECAYTLDGGTHTIQVMYSKDGSGNTSDDRGYFYIGECS